MECLKIPHMTLFEISSSLFFINLDWNPEMFTKSHVFYRLDRNFYPRHTPPPFQLFVFHLFNFSFIKYPWTSVSSHITYTLPCPQSNHSHFLFYNRFPYYYRPSLTIPWTPTPRLRPPRIYGKICQPRTSYPGRYLTIMSKNHFSNWSLIYISSSMEEEGGEGCVGLLVKKRRVSVCIWVKSSRPHPYPSHTVWTLTLVPLLFSGTP